MKHLWITLLVLVVITCASALAATPHRISERTKKVSSPANVVALTILAEARGEGQTGMYAVAAVIKQRALNRRLTPTQVCLQRKQFSCWNGKRVDARLLKTPQAKYAMMLASNIQRVNTAWSGYADHYHNKRITPYWAKGKRPIGIIKNHVFYKLR